VAIIIIIIIIIVIIIIIFSPWEDLIKVQILSTLNLSEITSKIRTIFS
jgi:hypothetical protein